MKPTNHILSGWCALQSALSLHAVADLPTWSSSTQYEAGTPVTERLNPSFSSENLHKPKPKWKSPNL